MSSVRSRLRHNANSCRFGGFASLPHLSRSLQSSLKRRALEKPAAIDEELMKRRRQFICLSAVLVMLSSCSTVSDLVVTHIPERHSGRARVVVDVGEQHAYLFRGPRRTASSRNSSGREGHRTPLGHFSVIVKTRIIAPVFTATMWTLLDESLGQTSMCGNIRARAALTSSARPCRFSSSSCPATDCTLATCPGNRRRTAAFACRTGRRGSSTMRSTPELQFSLDRRVLSATRRREGDAPLG